ncbi:MAG: hypothetical protein AB1847_01030 [bacterium]
MRQRIIKNIVTRGLLIVLIGLSLAVEAATLNVPSKNWSTLQDAINKAQDGDTISISPGKYQENLVIDGKSVNIERKGSEGAVILDGGNKGPCLILKNGSNGRIEGLIIQNGNARGNADEGGGIACYQSSPRIVNNIFRNNVADRGLGGGIFCYQSCAVIERNKFLNNRAGQGEGSGVFALRSTVHIGNNEFAGNLAEQGEGGGISLMESTGEINTNSFNGNLADQGRDIYLQHSTGNGQHNSHYEDKDNKAVFLNYSTF